LASCSSGPHTASPKVTASPTASSEIASDIGTAEAEQACAGYSEWVAVPLTSREGVGPPSRALSAAIDHAVFAAQEDPRRYGELKTMLSSYALQAALAPGADQSAAEAAINAICGDLR
jgi:hypothetical protein